MSLSSDNFSWFKMNGTLCIAYEPEYCCNFSWQLTTKYIYTNLSYFGVSMKCICMTWLSPICSYFFKQSEMKRWFRILMDILPPACLHVAMFVAYTSIPMCINQTIVLFFLYTTGVCPLHSLHISAVQILYAFKVHIGV